jgi:hypothetical protein
MFQDLIEEQASTIEALLDEREVMLDQIDALLKEIARLVENEIARQAAPSTWAEEFARQAAKQ